MTDVERISLRRSYIEELAKKFDINISHIDFLPGGRTNESYILYSDSKKYFVRIAGAGTDAIIDRKKELHNINAAHTFGVAPHLYCATDQNLLCEYVEGTSTTDTNILLNPDTLSKVTEQMRKLHAAPNVFHGNFSFVHDYMVYKNDFLSTGCPIPDELLKYEAELCELMSYVDQHFSDDKCPCHGDIVLQNFIITPNRAYIVDWEYSTTADRYLDLASFVIQNDLNEKKETLFLNSYFSDNPEKLNYQKFLLYKMSISFMWVYWHLSNVAHNKQPEYNGPRWKQRLQNAIENKVKWECLQTSPILEVNKSVN